MGRIVGCLLVLFYSMCVRSCVTSLRAIHHVSICIVFVAWHFVV
uniref:Uncharacterized protein n=1 Tax=Ciona intestinalis TaxID=7719 RepID=H2XKT1_CIOIN